MERPRGISATLCKSFGIGIVVTCNDERVDDKQTLNCQWCDYLDLPPRCNPSVLLLLP